MNVSQIKHENNSYWWMINFKYLSCIICKLFLVHVAYTVVHNLQLICFLFLMYSFENTLIVFSDSISLIVGIYYYKKIFPVLVISIKRHTLFKDYTSTREILQIEALKDIDLCIII